MSKNAPGAKNVLPASRRAATSPTTAARPRVAASTDFSFPLKSVRHEKFAQLAAMGKPDAEAYRLAGFKGQHTNKRAAEIRANQGIQGRIAWLRADADSKSQLSKDQAMLRCAELANGQHGAEPGHRIAAMALLGKWCGWEQGTQAEQAAAQALGGVADMMRRIRGGRA